MRKSSKHVARAVCAGAIGAIVLSGCSSAKSGSTAAAATATHGAVSTPTATTMNAAVQPCTQQQNGNNYSGAATPPATVSDFHGVSFDSSSMSLYGVPLLGAAQTIIGQTGASCSYFLGGDGSVLVTATGSQATLYETYSPGGIEIDATDLCDAFPELASVIATQMGADDPSCTYKGSANVHELATGLPIQSLRVGIIKISAGSAGYLTRQVPASATYDTWQLDFGNTHVAMGSAGTSLDFKSMACTAAPAEQKLCTVSFEYFISNLISQSGYGKPNLSGLYAAIAGYVGK